MDQENALHCPVCKKLYTNASNRKNYQRNSSHDLTACDECLRSKIRCGSDSGCCSRCASKGIACTYQNTPRSPVLPAVEVVSVLASITKAFAAGGSTKIAILSRTEKNLLATKHAIEKQFPSTQNLAIPEGITDSAQINDAFVSISETFGKIDVLVCNSASCQILDHYSAQISMCRIGGQHSTTPMFWEHSTRSENSPNMQPKERMSCISQLASATSHR